MAGGLRGAGFSLRGFGPASTKPRRLKPAPQFPEFGWTRQMR